MVANTRQKILDVAYDLVLQKGYPATTVDEICDAAGVSKGSFYHFFKTKEEMGLALLAGFYEAAQERLFGAEWPGVEDPAARLMAFIDYTEENADSFWGEGCLLGGFAIDVAQTNPVMQEKISMIFGSLAQRIAPVYEVAARADGPTAVELAEQWLSVIEGSIVLARGHKDASHIATALSVHRDYVGRLLEWQPVG
jgi:TetR/AcrR family transcriptional repressor of nem operon